ncbi:MAG: sel1 repeat family protein [Nitrospira sp. CG24E]|nr:MAG: sel1 repeat family protein [Nitrospira sp. CG24E]
MATKGYPGLVVVPPSDRSILRRRLFYGGVVIIALVWGASASKFWVPPSNSNDNCQTASGQAASSHALKECGQSGQSAAETQSSLGKFSVAEASQGGSMVALRSSLPIPSKHMDQLSTLHVEKQELRISHNGPAGRSSERAISPPSVKELTPSAVAKSAESSPSPDTRLAQQGDAFAQYRLGRFYAQLSGPKAPESVSWYAKASDGLQRLAEAGNGQAMYVLGVMYAFGRGVAKDEEQARLWLTQAVDQQVPEAHQILAKLDGYSERRLQIAGGTPSAEQVEIATKPVSAQFQVKRSSGTKRSPDRTFLTDYTDSH